MLYFVCGNGAHVKSDLRTDFDAVFRFDSRG